MMQNVAKIDPVEILIRCPECNEPLKRFVITYTPISFRCPCDACNVPWSATLYYYEDEVVFLDENGLFEMQTETFEENEKKA